MILRAGKYEQWNSVFTHHLESNYENYIFLLLKKSTNKSGPSSRKILNGYKHWYPIFFHIKGFLQNVEQYKTNCKYKITTKVGLSNRKKIKIGGMNFYICASLFTDNTKSGNYRILRYKFIQARNL